MCHVKQNKFSLRQNNEVREKRNGILLQNTWREFLGFQSLQIVLTHFYTYES